MRISLIQSDIAWANKADNLCVFEQKIASLSGNTDLAVLPEMFSTGFCTNALHLAETIEGETVQKLQQWAAKYQLAIVGSFMAKDCKQYYNRGFIALPNGDIHFYDKHHLFSMGNEHRFFTAGNKRLIVNYQKWNICLQICYDLRFPAWNRNLNNKYDLLIFVANWPTARIYDWNTLLAARAIENQAFVCGVNRVGTDGENISYSGQSVLFDTKGKALLQAPSNEETIITAKINIRQVQELREKFPVWKDADDFTITS